MGKTYDSIPADLIEWAMKQKMFWVATAPLSGDGHVNVSPKGIEGTFHIVNPNQCWYEDLTGSGVETISHLRENGRITIMFQAFEGAPRIMRFYGKGTVHEFGTSEYERLLPSDKRHISSRAAIVVDIHRVGTVGPTGQLPAMSAEMNVLVQSCGWGIPKYVYQEERTNTWDYFRKMEAADQELAQSGHNPSEPPPEGTRTMKYYWSLKNTASIDGLAGLRLATRSDRVPKTTLPHRFREDAERERTQVGKIGLEVLLREGKFIIGVLVGVTFALGYLQALKIVQH
ncbi:hypothetical protein AURDEDRAFT_50811 [Auricularia subglabra TFB-10046 SS5]|nr:hypothetical protein AURDEDRAFT_50811 [Auricularia subglabra TFB-10046 SS5]